MQVLGKLPRRTCLLLVSFAAAVSVFHLASSSPGVVQAEVFPGHAVANNEVLTRLTESARQGDCIAPLSSCRMAAEAAIQSLRWDPPVSKFKHILSLVIGLLIWLEGSIACLSTITARHVSPLEAQGVVMCMLFACENASKGQWKCNGLPTRNLSACMPVETWRKGRGKTCRSLKAPIEFCNAGLTSEAT